MKAKQMWLLYRQKSNPPTDEFDSWSFGDDPDRLAKLVMEGKKSATASAYDLYAYDGEEIPKVGDYSVVLDSSDEAVCVIMDTDVQIVPFKEVGEEHARLEGEGDLSLEYWRRVHEDFFTKELADARMRFTEDTMIVLERFKVVFRP